MRKTLGTAVFSGMLGVTLFGIFLTPVFYYVIQWFSDQRCPRKAEEAGRGIRRRRRTTIRRSSADGDHAQPSGNGVVHAGTHVVH